MERSISKYFIKDKKHSYSNNEIGNIKPLACFDYKNNSYKLDYQNKDNDKEQFIQSSSLVTSNPVPNSENVIKINYNKFDL